MNNETKYYAEKFLRIFGYNGMDKIETEAWFLGAGLSKEETKKALKQVLK